jgi:hypothetical protein
VLLASAALTACAVPSPYEKPAPPPEQQPPETSPETRPGEPPSTTPEPTPPQTPVVREPTLGAASRALVNQAQTQMATKNYIVAASSIERAKVRFAEGNYLQAENMARKAVSMSVNAPRAQSSAWRLIADSYRARGKNIEAQEAQARADSLNSG